MNNTACVLDTTLKISQTCYDQAAGKVVGIILCTTGVSIAIFGIIFVVIGDGTLKWPDSLRWSGRNK